MKDYKTLSRTEVGHLRSRYEAISAYGGVCVCCGERRAILLSLDHKAGDGYLQRSAQGEGTRLYSWARRNNWPDSLQVLCYNCNLAKRMMLNCPCRDDTRTSEEHLAEIGLRRASGRPSRVSEETVDEIRRRYALGVVTQKALGKEYGVSQSHVGRILGRKRRT